MAARHRKHGKHHKSGGKIENAGGNPEVEKEAEEKKRGGRAMGKMHGKHGKHRLDRPGRKRGGRVGADLSPLSTATRHSSPDKEPMSQEGGASHD